MQTTLLQLKALFKLANMTQYAANTQQMLRRGLSTHPSPPHQLLRAPLPVCRELQVGALQNTTVRPASHLSASADRDRLSTNAARAYSAPAPTDDAFMTDSDPDEAADLEAEFEAEKNSRSLASLFGGEENVIEIDAEYQDDALKLDNCGLSDVTLEALRARGITSLFPIQKHVYEPANSGRDLIGRAKTGSGKTLAFALPVIEKIMKQDAESPARRNSPRCIILAPTRELAKQVEREFQESAPKLRTGCFYGGAPIGPQCGELRRGIDVVVGTPGRVIDLLNRGDLRLDQVQFAILDEADTMLDVGFGEDIERILQDVPKSRQTMLFSATMPQWVQKVTQRYQNNPVLVDLIGESGSDSGKLAENIRVLGVQVPYQQIQQVLPDLLTVYAGTGKIIVFSQTKRDCDALAESLKRTLPTEALHGDIAQNTREKVMQRFRDGKFSVLVATDVAARGLDVPDVDLVIHSTLPQDIESFTHRSGRTGRAGKSGTTIAMFSPRERQYFHRIMKSVKAANVEMISIPDPKTVMHASARNMLRRLDLVDEEIKSFFDPAAETVLASGYDPKEALARALAAMSGINEVPQPRSLLTQTEGSVTLRVLSRPGRITNTGHIFTIVRNVCGEQALSGLGKIQMVTDAESEQTGAAFDVPEAIAEEMLKKVTELEKRNFALDRPRSLPMDTMADRGPGGYDDRSGGRNSRNSRGGGGNYSRGGGGGGGNFNRGGSRYDNDRGSRGGQSFGGQRDSWGGGGQRDSYGSRNSRGGSGGRFSNRGGGNNSYNNGQSRWRSSPSSDRDYSNSESDFGTYSKSSSWKGYN